MRAFCFVCLILAMVAFPGAVWACVGARPLAMGGAFVAVADDVEATYWNPAGLAQFRPGATESTLMHTATNRDEINYQDYFAVASRFASRSGRQSTGYALGASFISNKRYFEDTRRNVLIEDDEQWFWVSAAFELSPRTMIGVNARAVVDDAPSAYPITTEPGFDFGLLHHVNDRLNLGLLIQDLNQPSKKYAGILFAPYARNWRPGISYRPTERSVVALDGYDVADEGGCRSLRIGGEVEMGRYTLRAGYYGLAGSGVPRSATFGLGIRQGRGSIDLALLAGDLDNTFIMSGTFRLD